jgi:hypothetical protein
VISKKRSHPDLRKITKNCHGAKGRICVPNAKELKGKLLREAHKFAYSIHPGGNEMYHDLKATYWCYGIKGNVAKYVALCDRESGPSINKSLDCCNFCKYPSSSGKKLLWILSWNYLGLSLDVIPFGKIVDRLTKVAHFVSVKVIYTGSQLAWLYSSRIVYSYRVPMRIVLGIGTQFISKFTERLL